MDVDHFVPLKEVHQSGGDLWSEAKKMKYANDLANPETLIAVHKSANRSKGAKDPSDWMPPNEDYGCEYIKTWQEIKIKWDLEMDEKEATFVKNKVKECEL